MTTTLEGKTCANVSCGSKFVPKSVKHAYCSKECRTGAPAAEADPKPLPRFTLTDESNHLLTIVPSAMSCGVTDIQGEQVLLLTIRTTSATVTTGLTYKEAAAWLAEFAYKVKAMQDAQGAAASGSAES